MESSKSFNLLSFLAHNLGFLKPFSFLTAILDTQLKAFTFLFRPRVFKSMKKTAQNIKNMEGVTSTSHIYGGLEFQWQDKEIGHIHGNGFLDIRFHPTLKQSLLNAHLVEHHHFLPQKSGWITHRIRKDAQLPTFLLSLSLDYLNKTQTLPELLERITQFSNK